MPSQTKPTKKDLVKFREDIEKYLSDIQLVFTGKLTVIGSVCNGTQKQALFSCLIYIDQETSSIVHCVLKSIGGTYTPVYKTDSYLLFDSFVRNLINVYTVNTGSTLNVKQVIS